MDNTTLALTWILTYLYFESKSHKSHQTERSALTSFSARDKNGNLKKPARDDNVVVISDSDDVFQPGGVSDMDELTGDEYTHAATSPVKHGARLSSKVNTPSSMTRQAQPLMIGISTLSASRRRTRSPQRTPPKREAVML